jgi:hypothetical protein
MKSLPLTSLAIAIATAASAAPAPQPLKIKSAAASSSLTNYPAANAIDGKVTDASRWVSEKSTEPSWLALDLGEKRKLAGIHLFTGYGTSDVISAFKVQFWSGGKWMDIPSADVSGNKAAHSPSLSIRQSASRPTNSASGSPPAIKTPPG